MGKRERYEPGTFSWVDLATSDPEDAKRFYGDLFGWEPEDMPVPGGAPYTMLRLDGDDVAALYAQPAERREQGIPPSWLSYVTTDDADATAARASELGGTVHAEPFEVMEAGRMAVIADPTGAILLAWQPRGMIGAARVNDPGCLTWNELATGDVGAATRFYSGLFGWEIEAMDTGGGPEYSVIRLDGRSNGGIRALDEQQGGMVPSHWLPYFTVASCDGATARVSELGGRTLAAPMDVPQGRIAAVGDRQGAAFAVFEGEVDD